jgi:septation ring formation regulator EzrA
VLEMEENLTSLKTKIKEMKSKAGKSKDDTVVKLEKKQKNLEHDIAKMKKSSGQAWDKLKSGVSKAWSDIKSSMGEASAELTK